MKLGLEKKDFFKQIQIIKKTIIFETKNKF